MLREEDKIPVHRGEGRAVRQRAVWGQRWVFSGDDGSCKADLSQAEEGTHESTLSALLHSNFEASQKHTRLADSADPRGAAELGAGGWWGMGRTSATQRLAGSCADCVPGHGVVCSFVHSFTLSVNIS